MTKKKKKNPVENVHAFDPVVSLVESVPRKSSGCKQGFSGIKILIVAALILIKFPMPSTAPRGIIYGIVVMGSYTILEVFEEFVLT